MKPLLVSSGEPAGIGPDLCLALANCDIPLVILGDQAVLAARAKQLHLEICFISYQSGMVVQPAPGCLTVMSIPCNSPVVAGSLNPQNGDYVIELLTTAANKCAQGEFAALVTAPVHKANINEAGIAFTGHTEFFAQFYDAKNVVMMLACEQMRVALVTTHLPLREVPDAISTSLIVRIISQVQESLMNDFGLVAPLIKVAGLNPHAGESGYLGREEIDCIIPACEILRKKGMNILGPLPADTMFTQDEVLPCDAYIAMYHDQGLPVLKYAGFNHSVNVTLGLPIIRTSVDHGTALELAGKGTANADSLIAAVSMANSIALSREKNANN